MLFGTQKPVLSAPEVELNATAIENWFSYLIGKAITDSEGIITNESRAKGLLLIVAFIILTFFLKNLTRYLAMYSVAPLRNGIIHDLRKSVYSKVLDLHLLYFSNERKGDIMSRLSNDVQEIEWAILNSLEVLFREPLAVCVFLFSLFVLSPSLTLFALVLLPVSALMIGQIAKSLRKNSADVQQTTGTLLSLIEETISGLSVIKVFGAQEVFTKKFDTLNRNLQRLNNRIIRKRDLASPLSEFLGATVMAALIWYGGNMVLDGNSGLTAPTFIAYIAIFSQIIAPAKAFSSATYHIQKGIASAIRINEILSAPTAVSDVKNPIEKLTFDKEIRFEHVSFSYNNSAVLHSISFSIKKGQTIALVGRSGAGKSTITGLITRLFHPTSGKIFVDEVEIKNLDQKSLQRLIKMVPQQSVLFNDSIEQNICLGRVITKNNSVQRALEIANANDFIQNLPEGLAYNVGDNGNKLSGGQRQRICIARAVFDNPPILILDEATSSLDTENENAVQLALENLTVERTSLIIAHRLSTVQKADLILVLDKGKIVESGTHTELMSQKGLYYEMASLQNFD